MLKIHGYEYLKQLIHDDTFLEYVESLKEDSTQSDRSRAINLMSRYDIKSWLIEVVVDYFKSGHLDSKLANDPVKIIKQGSYGDLSLKPAHDVTLPVLLEYINSKWMKEIKPILENSVKAPRGTIIFNPKRNNDIYHDYLNKKPHESNLSIALKYNISLSTLQRIIKRKKN